MFKKDFVFCALICITLFSIGHEARAGGLSGSCIAEWGLGGASSFLIHETGHLITGKRFGSNATLYFPPGKVTVKYTNPPTNRQQFEFSAAGFAAQAGYNELLLTINENYENRHLNCLAAGAVTTALIETIFYGLLSKNHPERNDLLNMSQYSGINEGELRAMIGLKFAVDLYRYMNPESRWALTISRGTSLAVLATYAIDF